MHWMFFHLHFFKYVFLCKAHCGTCLCMKCVTYMCSDNFELNYWKKEKQRKVIRKLYGDLPIRFRHVCVQVEHLLCDVSLSLPLKQSISPSFSLSFYFYQFWTPSPFFSLFVPSRQQYLSYFTNHLQLHQSDRESLSYATTILVALPANDPRVFYFENSNRK